MGRFSYSATAVIVYSHTLLAVQDAILSWADVPTDGRLNFTELAIKYGYKCDEYKITTEDKYLLTPSRPMFLMHGFPDSADTFIIRGHGSLALTLAKAGYDVWLGNMRGNKYSRHHLTLNPDKEKKFWDFSLHEIGYFDLPATIDFVMSKTSTTQLTAIGHSEGTTVFYVLGSTRPEYNNKVNLFISLAPVAYLQDVKPPLSAVLQAGPALNALYLAAGQEEFLGNMSIAITLLRVACTSTLAGKVICADDIYSAIFGYDNDVYVDNVLPIIVAHYPVGTSRKNAVHLSQIARRKQFAQFDYGLENLFVYNSITPPEYELHKVTMPMALLVGHNDKVATIEDVEILRSQLPNVVVYRILEYKKMTHFDFTWGAHMEEYLFPDIFDVLRKF